MTIESLSIELPTATAAQFGKLVWRMMPANIQAMPEGRLMSEIFRQAWADAEKHSARKFFLDSQSMMVLYCDKCGLNADQIREIFIRHNDEYRLYSKSLA